MSTVNKSQLTVETVGGWLKEAKVRNETFANIRHIAAQRDYSKEQLTKMKTQIVGAYNDGNKEVKDEIDADIIKIAKAFAYVGDLKGEIFAPIQAYNDDKGSGWSA